MLLVAFDERAAASNNRPLFTFSRVGSPVGGEGAEGAATRVDEMLEWYSKIWASVQKR